MAKIRLIIDDPATAYTLRAMYEASGHEIVSEKAEVCVAETPKAALAVVGESPTLVLSTAACVGDAVAAMAKGVFGYIFMPLQPGEATLMVERALAGNTARTLAREEAVELAALEDVERRHILNVLRLSKHNQAKAARALGIGRNTLWRKLKQYKASDESKEK